MSLILLENVLNFVPVPVSFFLPLFLLLAAVVGGQENNKCKGSC